MLTDSFVKEVFLKRGEDLSVGVLCIHGFSGGPYEIEPFTTYLRTHTDWLIVEPTLWGMVKLCTWMDLRQSTG